MKTILHTSASRGLADHGWLKSRHTFSFGHYYNPERMNFGVLRVLNDDYVEGGQGFGSHPHRDMEIISIPLAGDLAHRDSMGNGSTIRHGEIQAMSAGTGITHSEMNPNRDIPVQFLQIWVLPRTNGVAPRYQQTAITAQTDSAFRQIVSPHESSEGVWIHQDAWFFLADLSAGSARHYQVKRKENGVYAFVIQGEAEIAGISLQRRDGLGLWETDGFDINASTDAQILLMDVPMDVAAHTGRHA